jgi:hypothetical protein
MNSINGITLALLVSLSFLAVWLPGKRTVARAQKSFDKLGKKSA